MLPLDAADDALIRASVKVFDAACDDSALSLSTLPRQVDTVLKITQTFDA